MIRLMPQDWEITAYEAALRGDDDGIIASLRELNTFGVDAIERALRSWMQRTSYVMHCLASSGNRPVAFQVEAHPTDAGRPQIDPEMAWAGQLFAAHVQGNTEQWSTLFEAIPPGEPLDSVVTITLKMLAVTAEQANTAVVDMTEQSPTEARSDHRFPPLLRAARMARAHLN